MAAFDDLVQAAHEKMVRNVKPGEVPGRVHRSISGDPIGIGAFNARDARFAAAEHGKVCQNEACVTHETLTKPSVRIATAVKLPVLGLRPVERLLTPGEARLAAATLWAAAGLAEGD